MHSRYHLVKPPRIRLSVGGMTVGIKLDKTVDSALDIAFGKNQPAEAQAIRAGIGLLDNILQGNIKDGWQGAHAALNVAKAIPVPVVQVVAEIGALVTSVLFELFGDKPCEFLNRPDCRLLTDPSDPVRQYAEGSKKGDRCCFPRPTGRGIILTEREPGVDTNYPGQRATEAPAWDYPYISCAIALRNRDKIKKYLIPEQDLPAVDIIPCTPFKDNVINGALVPSNWRIKLFSEPEFKGSSVVLEVGAHPLKSGDIKFANKAKSFQIRGPWTLQDGNIGKHLINREDGWVTQYMTAPNWETVMQLITLDPMRPAPPQDFNVNPQPYLSLWRPGWFFRLSNAGVIDEPVVKSILESVGIGDRQIKQENVKMLEKMVMTTNLLIEASKLDEKTAKNTLESLFRVDPQVAEIAKSIIDKRLQETSLPEFKGYLETQLQTAERESVGSVYGYYLKIV